MSGYTGNINKGDRVYYKEKWRTVKRIVFFSSPVHNSDEIFIVFGDETTTGASGLYGIKTKDDLEGDLLKTLEAINQY